MPAAATAPCRHCRRRSAPGRSRPLKRIQPSRRARGTVCEHVGAANSDVSGAARPIVVAPSRRKVLRSGDGIDSSDVPSTGHRRTGVPPFPQVHKQLESPCPLARCQPLSATPAQSSTARWQSPRRASNSRLAASPAVWRLQWAITAFVRCSSIGGPEFIISLFAFRQQTAPLSRIFRHRIVQFV